MAQHDLSREEKTILRQSGVTKNTTWSNSYWRANLSQEFLMVDTPGINDPLGKQADKAYLSDMVDAFSKTIGDINCFIYTFKMDSTFRPEEYNVFQTFYALFGKEFFKHLIIEVTWWSQQRTNRLKRRKEYLGQIGNDGINDSTLKLESMEIQNMVTKTLNDLLKSKFNVSHDIPVVFIDYYFYEWGVESDSDLINQQQLDKLHQLLFIEMNRTFSCRDDCQNVVDLFRYDKVPIVNINEAVIFNAGVVTIECLVWRDNTPTSIINVDWEKNNETLAGIAGNTSIQLDDSNVFERHHLDIFVLGEDHAGKYACVDATNQKKSSSVDIKFFANPPTMKHNINHLGKIIFECLMDANDTNLLTSGGYKIHFKRQDERYFRDVTDLNFDSIVSTKDMAKFKATSADSSFSGSYRCEKIGYGFGRDSLVTVPRKIKGKYKSHFDGNFESLLMWFKTERMEVDDRVYILENWTSNRNKRSVDEVRKILKPILKYTCNILNILAQYFDCKINQKLILLFRN